MAVVVRRAEPAVDLGGRKHEPASLGERDDLVHRDGVGPWPGPYPPVPPMFPVASTSMAATAIGSHSSRTTWKPARSRGAGTSTRTPSSRSKSTKLRISSSTHSARSAGSRSSARRARQSSPGCKARARQGRRASGRHGRLADPRGERHALRLDARPGLHAAATTATPRCCSPPPRSSASGATSSREEVRFVFQHAEELPPGGALQRRRVGCRRRCRAHHGGAPPLGARDRQGLGCPRARSWRPPTSSGRDRRPGWPRGQPARDRRPGCSGRPGDHQSPADRRPRVRPLRTRRRLGDDPRRRHGAERHPRIGPPGRHRAGRCHSHGVSRYATRWSASSRASQRHIVATSGFEFRGEATTPS